MTRTRATGGDAPATDGDRPPDYRRPPRLSLGAALLFGGATAATAGAVSGEALAVALVGLAVLVGGLLLHRRVAVLLGALGLFGSVVVAGVTGAPVPVVIGGLAAGVVTWDAADNAISLGKHVGCRSRSVRNETVHLGATAGIAALTAGAGYGVFRLASNGQPVTALVSLLLAAALLITALSE